MIAFPTKHMLGLDRFHFFLYICRRLAINNDLD